MTNDKFSDMLFDLGTTLLADALPQLPDSDFERLAKIVSEEKKRRQTLRFDRDVVDIMAKEAIYRGETPKPQPRKPALVDPFECLNTEGFNRTSTFFKFPFGELQDAVKHGKDVEKCRDFDVSTIVGRKNQGRTHAMSQNPTNEPTIVPNPLVLKIQDMPFVSKKIKKRLYSVGIETFSQLQKMDFEALIFFAGEKMAKRIQLWAKDYGIEIG